MKRTLITTVVALSGFIMLAHAADQPSGTLPAAPATTNKTTIMATTVLSPGRYTSSVSPNINGEMATRITKSLGTIPGLDSIKANHEDSSIHFTIKPGAHVPISSIEQAVAKSDHGVVISVPVLEHSEAAHLGM
jgi:hypothetical protein